MLVHGFVCGILEMVIDRMTSLQILMVVFAVIGLLLKALKPDKRQ